MTDASYTGSPYTNQSAAASPSMLGMLRSILAGQQQNSGGGASAPNPAMPSATTATSQSGGATPDNPYGGAGSLIKGILKPPPTSILGQAKSSLFGGPGQSSGSGGAPPPPTAGPTLSNGAPANTYEGNINTQANPFSQSTGQFGMPSQQASLTNPGPSGGMTSAVPLPQPNPNGAFSGAAAPGADAFNPAGVDPMTAALMANGAPQVAPDALASAAPDALSSLFL